MPRTKFIIIGIALITLVFLGLRTYIKSDQYIKSAPFSLDEIKAIPEFELKKPQFAAARDGVSLAYYPFLPEIDPRHIIIFYHGAGLYANKTYQWIGLQLAQKYHLGCYLVDMRGHGLSGGPRGDAASIEQVWQDISTIVDLVSIKHPSAKIYLAGHSAGAGLILNYSGFQNKRAVNGYVLIAPYLGPQSGTLRQNLDREHSFVKRVRVWVYIINSFLNFEKLKHLTAVVFNYPKTLLEQDPLIVSSYSYTMSCATTPYNPHDLFKKIDTPFSLYIGSEDEQFLPDSVIAFKNQTSPVSDRSFAKIIVGAKHISILLDAADLIATSIEANDDKERP